MLIFYFGTNNSCPSSFLYVNQFPTSVIFFQPEKVPLALLVVQICRQSILSTFIHLKMSLFYPYLHGIWSLDIEFWVDYPSLCSLPTSSNSSSLKVLFCCLLACVISHPLLLFFFLFLYIVCHLPVGIFIILLFICDFQWDGCDVNITRHWVNFLPLLH